MMAKKRGPSRKDILRIKLLGILSNPEGEFPTRGELSSMLGYAQVTGLYKHFSPDELAEIEHEALELRRKKYSRFSTVADHALVQKMREGDVAAISLYYKRLEGWSEKQQIEATHKVLVEMD